MKILKICGIVAGLHVVAFLAVIFVTPGCSSSTGQPAPPAASQPPQTPSDTVPTIKLPNSGTVFYSPTRPGTPAASALVTQPVADVTPAATYTVRSGDSLWTIAKKNHIAVADLAAANKLKTSAALKLGQKLIIPSKETSSSSAPSGTPALAGGAPAMASSAGAPPPAATSGPMKAAAGATKHIVKKNETLGSIAHAYGLKTSDLAVANSISDPKKIRPGQELIIPAGGRSSKSGKSSAAAAMPESAGSRPAPENPPASPPGLPPPSPAPESGGSAPAGPGADVPVIKIEPAQPAPAK